MKIFIVLVLAQLAIAYAAPSEPTLQEQVKQTIETARKEAAVAVEAAHKKLLETSGVKTNQELVGKLDTQATDFGTQLKELATRFGEEATAQADKLKPDFKSFADSLSTSAANLLAGDDKAKSDQLQASYGNVLNQVQVLQSRFTEEGANVQKTFEGLFSQLLETTRQSATNFAKQLDDTTSKP